MRVMSPYRLTRGHRWTALAALLLAAGTLAAPAQADPSVFPSGLDLSHHNHDAGPFDWSQIMTSAPVFAISKATEGSTFTDPQFVSDYAAEQANGLARGTYHYAQPAAPMATAVAQADFYAATIGGQLQTGDLPPVLDLEVNNGLLPRDLISWTQTFLGELMAKTGRVPIIYTGRNFWRTQMADSSAFIRYPLWIADFTPGGDRADAASRRRLADLDDVAVDRRRHSAGRHRHGRQGLLQRYGSHSRRLRRRDARDRTAGGRALRPAGRVGRAR